jgi:hypothetical protein
VTGSDMAMTAPLPFSGQGVRAVALAILVWWLARKGRTDLAERVVRRL